MISNSASCIVACEVERCILKTKRQAGVLSFVTVNATPFYDIKATLSKLQNQDL